VRFDPVRRPISFLSLVPIALLLTAARPGSSARDRMVVLISIDGLPAFSFDDPRLPAPTLRRLAAEGVQARGMAPVNPSGTWPSHTSMVTGVRPDRHGVLTNGALIRSGPGRPVSVDRWRDRSEVLRAPAVYDLAHEMGLTTAQVNWVAIQNAPTITWEFGYRPHPQGAVEREMIAAGLLAQADVDEFRAGKEPWHDQIWTQAAVHIMIRHRPNLMLFHLLAVDDLHHRYGPNSLGGSAAIALADTRVRDLIEALEREGLDDRTTVFVVSDHGFKPALRSVRPNAFLREQGLLRGGSKGIECEAYVVTQGGNALVYVTDPENRARLVPRLTKLFAGLEGVARVAPPSEYAALGLPTPSENGTMGDLMLFARDGYWFSDKDDGPVVLDTVPGTTVGTHGYPSDDPDMSATFIAWGYGIRKGVRLDTVHVTDLAPTMAELLGMRMVDVEGRPLREIME
jgi:predicted AlkP superfamily pyrophosphatase or phosphodiesterase